METAMPTAQFDPQFDPQLDLLLERIVPVRTSLVWQAWTDPVELPKWFTPAPYATVACEIDLRPGGVFRTVMRSPEGEEYPNVGCFLEVIPGERLTWTSAMGPGFRPGGGVSPFHFTAVISMEPVDGGTRYSALVRHADAAGRDEHHDMGFHDGWGAALDQLVALMQGR